MLFCGLCQALVSQSLQLRLVKGLLELIETNREDYSPKLLEAFAKRLETATQSGLFIPTSPQEVPRLVNPESEDDEGTPASFEEDH